jgi:hypothetical protein
MNAAADTFFVRAVTFITLRKVIETGRLARVPRMRCAEESAPAGAVSCGGGGKPGPFGKLPG